MKYSPYDNKLSSSLDPLAVLGLHSGSAARHAETARKKWQYRVC